MAGEGTLKSCGVPLAQQYHLALLDLDGVVYRGANSVAYAADAVRGAASLGMRVCYTTNNPSRPPQAVANQIAGFGIPVSPDQIVTSAAAVAFLLAQELPVGAVVLVIGADALKDAVRRAGFRVVDGAWEDPAAVVEGWYPSLCWTQLAQAAYAIERGARYFATNLDRTIPREDGIAPGNGAMIGAVTAATGVAPCRCAGKPESVLYDIGLRRTGVVASDALAVGDRLDTDIEAASREGCDSLCVLTGVTDARTLLFAAPKQRPTYIAADLRGLLEMHAAPALQGVLCQDGTGENGGGNRLAVDGDIPCVGMSDVPVCCATLPGLACAVCDAHSRVWSAGPAMDRLRCLCQLSWALADAGVAMQSLDFCDFSVVEEELR
ncbi:MAG: HAD-IIA family hydrolase [Bifidobacteriaceae bacterium]|nr:HAD-IIA family hydrolase [Bifidobacteriaceae bacterium]